MVRYENEQGIKTKVIRLVLVKQHLLYKKKQKIYQDFEVH